MKKLTPEEIQDRLIEKTNELRVFAEQNNCDMMLVISDKKKQDQFVVGVGNINSAANMMASAFFINEEFKNTLITTAKFIAFEKIEIGLELVGDFLNETRQQTKPEKKDTQKED